MWLATRCWGSELAFRGGTCLHKLHAPRASRYSNDLDYVRTTTGPIQGIMAALREVVLVTGLEEADYEQKRDAVSRRASSSAHEGGPRRIGGALLRVADDEARLDELEASLVTPPAENPKRVLGPPGRQSSSAKSRSRTSSAAASMS